MGMAVLEAVGYLKAVGEHERFVGEYLQSGSRCDDLPPVHEIDAAAEIDDELQIMRRDHARGGETADEPGEIPPAPRVEIARRLVKDKYAGVACEDPRQADALLFTSAQVVRRSPFEPVEPDLMKRIPDDPVDLRGRESELLRTERHVFADRGTEELVVGILEEEPHRSVHLVEVGVREEIAADDDLAAPAVVGGEYAVQMEKERRFSRPVRPDNADAFPIPGVHRNALQGGLPVRVRVRESLHLERVHQRQPLAVMAE